MMPCSSGNSPTIAVSRSHLASCAARSAAAASAPMRSCDDAGQGRDARSLRCAQGAELRLESDRIERRATRGERLRAILLPEERGVGQARPHHALVAGAHHARARAVDVADRDEPRQQRAVASFEREIALMLLQRRDQHLARQRQEARLELPGKGHRPFHQRRDFIEQRVGDDGAAPEPLPPALRPARECSPRRSSKRASTLPRAAACCA